MFRVRGRRAERCGGNRSDARLTEGGKVLFLKRLVIELASSS